MAMAAGIATLEELRKPGRYVELERKGQLLSSGIDQVLQTFGGGVQFVRIGAIFCLFFTAERVVNYSSAKSSDTQRYAHFFRSMLKRGVYLPPSQFESCFFSLAMEDKMIQETVEAVKLALTESLE